MTSSLTTFIEFEASALGTNVRLIILRIIVVKRKVKSKMENILQIISINTSELRL